jgi:ribosomal protein L37AE/L43A
VRAIWHNTARRRAYLLGAALSLPLIWALALPDRQWIQAAGAATPGHEQLRCESCHVPAPGTFRQQVQAGARYLLGLRETPATIGMQPVDDARCVACHDRPNDRHPLTNLSEPRFAEAQAAHGVHHCTGCHREHHGARFTASPQLCSSCHHDTVVKGDPLEPSHAALFDDDRWETCLQCHDFHGNHDLRRGTHPYPASMDEAFDLSAVRSYLLDGARVYGASTHPAEHEK